MNKPNFVHLHAHTEYSLLDGAVRIADDKGKPSDLIKYVAQHKMPALAMTDHGNIFGAIEFYNCCQQEGIKPIIGMEAYVAPKSRTERSGTLSGSNNHLTLLAKNNQGYENLMKLTSLSYREGFYYKPRVDWESIEKYHEGIIALSGCLKGKIAEAALNGGEDAVIGLAGQYQEIFGKEHFYLEVMDHGIENQRKVDRVLQEVSKKTGIPLVATNDCHYFKKDDAFAHDVLLCIGTGKNLSDANRMKYASHEFYYKSPEEMALVFGEMPQAMNTTLDIAAMCNVELKFDRILLPQYEVPEGETMDSYLEKLCLDGIRKRYGQITPVIKNRLDEELSVIRRMGFSAYFLIVWDFVHFAKSNGVPVGPGRGSGAGSLVSYVLEITNIDPIKYGLLFERFLNPDRRTMPDLDIDFSDEGREKVINYVRHKYGSDSVAQIITFGSMLARLVIRDVGRVLEMPLAECDKIAKMIPKELGITINAAMQQVPEMKQLYNSDKRVKQLIDVSQKLEGLKRHTGVHAAGIVIVPTSPDKDITHYVPLAKGSKDVMTTQYNDEGLLKLGVLKMDFLGLRTLTVLDTAEKLVKARHNPEFDLYKISLEDENTYKLFAEARTAGIFQLESSGMRDLLRKLKPSNLEDVIALISLYRPGPMGSGMLNDFVARKHAKVKVKYDHPNVVPILKDTYGIIVYQEQVMQISRAIAGFTAGQADGLRKAMGKKIPEEITKLEATFIEGAKKIGVDVKIADKIFKQIVHFGGYGFNKSHATAYGLLAYQTAYLKANYPHEYMASLLTSNIGHGAIGKEEGSKIVDYIEDAQSMGIEILPPDVQKSFKNFTLEGKGAETKMRFGLLAIKNVGDGAVDEIIAAREKGEFKSFEDFCQRVDMKGVNKKVIESLVKAGAFDFCGSPVERTRAEIIHSMEAVMENSSKLRADLSIGQGSLFGMDGGGTLSENPAPRTGAARTAEWSEHELLSNEKEVLGFYLSGHPLAKYKREIAYYSTCHLAHLPQEGTPTIRVAGLIANVRRLITKQHKAPYARFKLEDLEGEIDCILFPKNYANFSTLVNMNDMVVVTGRLNRAGDDDSTQEMIVEDIITLEKARSKIIKKIVLNVSTTGLENDLIQKLKRILEANPGYCEVQFNLDTPSHGKVSIEPEMKVKITDVFMQDIKDILGGESWELVPRALDPEATKPRWNGRGD